MKQTGEFAQVFLASLPRKMTALSQHSQSPSHNGSLLSIGEASAYLGMHAQSLRRAVDDGSLECFTLPSGHRRFSMGQLRRYIGLDEEGGDLSREKIICLSRVSTSRQGVNFDVDELKEKDEDGRKSDLSRQVDVLKEHAKRVHGCNDPLVYADIGSGLSYGGKSRKNFERLTREILAGKHDGSIILAKTKDRIVRFGLELWLMLLEQHEIRLEFVEADPDQTEEQELTQDLLDILHVFSCRSYAKRG